MNKLIDPKSLDFSSLPHVELKKKSKLPSVAAVYLAVDGNGTVQYIGKTSNLKGRWESHHRFDQLVLMEGVRIFWLLVDNTTLLEGIELALVERFDPPLNNSKMSCRMMTVQVKLLEEDYEAFQRFCEQSSLTMSDVVRDRIKPNITKGHKLRKSDRDEQQ